MQQILKVTIARRSLALLGVDGTALAPRLVTAVTYYLSREDSGDSRAYPDFRRDGVAPEGEEIELRIDADLWARFVADAAVQRVSANDLLEHAVLYLAAAEDSGRLAEEVAEDLG